MLYVWAMFGPENLKGSQLIDCQHELDNLSSLYGNYALSTPVYSCLLYDRFAVNFSDHHCIYIDKTSQVIPEAFGLCLGWKFRYSFGAVTKFSVATSLPAYREHSSVKAIQEARIIGLVSQGFDSLLDISEITGLPQSTVSGRANDAIKHGKLRYCGYVIYKNRKRKRLVMAPAPRAGVQTSMAFQPVYAQSI